jgi:hypothetical protein
MYGPFGNGSKGGLKDEYHVLPADDYEVPTNVNWVNVSEKGVETQHRIKKTAVKKAKELAKKAGGEVVVHDSNGNEQQRKSYNEALDKMQNQRLPEGPGFDNDVNGSFDEFYGIDK